MVLRLEAEELTQYTDDLDADAKRDLLASMLHSVDAVLQFFHGVSVIVAPLDFLLLSAKGLLLNSGLILHSVRGLPASMLHSMDAVLYFFCGMSC